MNFDYPWQFTGRRSAVMARNGAVATSHPLAARTGVRVLEDGGNAADAAVAVAAVLNVVEPHMTGIGGDAFALVHSEGDVTALNASGGAPAAADIDDYRERTDATEDGEPVVPADGGLPVTTPGALDGWHRLTDWFGTREFGDLLGPAIDYAREGVPVSEWIARQWAGAASRFRQFDATSETFLHDGDAPEVGETFRNPTLAETFETVAEEGIGAFYGGEIGEAVVQRVQEHGGTLELSDLEAHEGEWTDPVSTEYRGVEVLEHPPNGQGTVALEALNVASAFDLPDDPTDPDRLHHLIEATKIGFADGYEYISDPDEADIPLDRMLSPEYGHDRAGEVGHRADTYDPKAGLDWAGGTVGRATEPGDPTAGDGPAPDNTVYLTVVDGDGMAVSLINSVYMSFGSALTAAGFALQNRGHSFSLDPTHNNCLAPEKRPFHTIIPAMLREDGEFRASWGVMGGSMQPQGHLQVVANLTDGLNPQAALDAPRFRWLEGQRVALETNRIPESVVTNLRGRGHRVVEEDEFFDAGGHWGGGQIVYRDSDGTLIAGSDPRRDGAAMGF
ncbi:gamma-glutamyltransferase [Salinirubrum litoreum]|uniref:Gamma-glutamyltransferase n=1 Tax=Salinirubrum litoreum TaxID=1126234 RepID=A0ABD5RAB6_9EURY|nr:gamma-glutamyltransferase [Salinirubrum litoreum]